MAGETIAPNHARITGGAPSSFDVSPALPGGLSLDAQTGLITGTPITSQRQATCTVSAHHGLDSVQAELRLTVTARGAWASVATAELYDPVANTWTATGGMVEPRTRATTHLLPNGKVLVTGGYNRASGVSFSNTAEVYDPATGTWTLLATPLSTARAQHAAELMPDGATLLVMGGVNASGFVASAERYAVDGSTTTPIAYGASGNVHQSVRLGDGSVLVMSDAGTTARRFDPSTSTWTTSTLNSTRSLPTMTVLADGRVLLAGGSNLNSAEIYNPDVNVWTTAASMANVRWGAVAQLLGDGRVLVVSGFDGVGEVNATERYTP